MISPSSVGPVLVMYQDPGRIYGQLESGEAATREISAAETPGDDVAKLPAPYQFWFPTAIDGGSASAAESPRAESSTKVQWAFKFALTATARIKVKPKTMSFYDPGFGCQLENRNGQRSHSRNRARKRQVGPLRGGAR